MRQSSEKKDLMNRSLYHKLQKIINLFFPPVPVMGYIISPEIDPDINMLVCKYRLTDIDREMTSQELADDKSKAVSMIPLEHYEISVTLNGRSLLICGDQTAVYHMTSDEDAANFINAVTSVKKAVTELPEWTALPPANGGYD